MLVTLSNSLRVSAFALVATFLADGAVAQGKLAIKTAKVIPGAGMAEIDKGIIVIENGVITAIAADAKVPWDAVVVDATKSIAFPGFIEANSSRGMDRPNENLEVAPFLLVRDSIDPVNFYFEDSLRWGVTTINVQQGNNTVVAGQGMVVKPFGLTLEEMAVKTNSGIKLSASPKAGFSAATQAQALRRAFGDLRRHLEQLVQEKKDGNDRARREALFQGRDLEGDKSKGRAMEGTAWKVEGLDAIPRGEIDEKQEPLLALVEGKLPAFIYCGRPMDVHRALEIARENGFLARTTLVVGPGAWKAADVIAQAGVPVVLDGELVHIEIDVQSGDEIETFVPGVFKQKGVRFALSSANASTESLWYQAALSVGLGLTRNEALAAVTSTPAEILGLGKRLGTLEVGKDGNVLLFSGDPLSVTSWIDHVFIEGTHAYDRSKDVRVKHLLEGRTPPNTMALGDTGEGAHPHDDGTPEPEEKKKEDKGEGDGR